MHDLGTIRLAAIAAGAMTPAPITVSRGAVAAAYDHNGGFFEETTLEVVAK